MIVVIARPTTLYQMPSFNGCHKDLYSDRAMWPQPKPGIASPFVYQATLEHRQSPVEDQYRPGC